MLTVDFDQLNLAPGTTALDVGCGQGRHAFELLRRGAQVYAVDRSRADIAQVTGMFDAMREAGEVPPDATALAIEGDAYHLPFPDATFDVVVISEVLEHLTQDATAISEVTRVLRPGGTLAVTVPRYWPERICWALSRAYHEVEGGHVRIYRRRELRGRLTGRGLVVRGGHHAHALHSPYWWLKCLFGPDNDRARLPQLYHRFLVYDLMRRPWWTRAAERALNPVLGKSLVYYLDKPRAAGGTG